MRLITVTKNVDVSVTLVITLFMIKYLLYVLLQELNVRFAEIALVMREILYTQSTVKRLINKVLDLVLNKNQEIKGDIKN